MSPQTVYLSPHFTLDELTVSQEAARDGLRNMPAIEQIDALRALCLHILEPLRERLKQPITVNSGFRSVTVNRRIGGSSSSQHCKGQAADIRVNGLMPKEIVGIIRAMELPVDQCIEEFGRWVHVSYGPRNRRQFLKARRVNGKTEYTPI